MLGPLGRPHHTFTVVLRSHCCYYRSHFRCPYSHVSITDDKGIAREFPTYVTYFLQNTLKMNDIYVDVLLSRSAPS